MIVEINSSDEISRCIVYNRAFEHDLHVDELLWRFENKDDEDVYHESAVLRRFAPYPSDVHGIGCRIAAKQNARKDEPEPGPRRRYYCGFRTAAVASLPTSGDGFLVVISHEPEDGEDAHVDVALTILVSGKSARANRRTNAGLALAEQFGRPDPHRCECDNDDEQHPFSLWGEDCLSRGLRDRWPTLRLDGSDTEQVAVADDVQQRLI